MCELHISLRSRVIGYPTMLNVCRNEEWFLAAVVWERNFPPMSAVSNTSTSHSHWAEGCWCNCQYLPCSNAQWLTFFFYQGLKEMGHLSSCLSNSHACFGPHKSCSRATWCLPAAGFFLRPGWAFGAIQNAPCLIKKSKSYNSSFQSYFLCQSCLMDLWRSIFIFVLIFFWLILQAEFFCFLQLLNKFDGFTYPKRKTVFFSLLILLPVSSIQ